MSQALYTPDTPAPWYAKREPAWRRAVDLLMGTDRMRERGELYLPRFEGEPDKAYQTRLSRTVLTNFYRAMATNMGGVMTAERIRIENSQLPQEFLENVDREGRDVHAFIAAQIVPIITRGGLHILTDYPPNPGVETLGQQRELGLRPYWAAVACENVIAATFVKEAGVTRLEHVRWTDHYTKRAGYGETVVKRVRELTLEGGKAVWRTHECPEGGTFAQVAEGGYTVERGGDLTLLPFASILFEGGEGLSTTAPLDDVAHKAVEHWQSASDQRNILTLSRFPMRFEKGTEQPATIVGPGMTLHANKPEVEWGYIEPVGTGIEAGERDLARIQQEAEMIGLRLMARASQRAASDADADLAKDKSPLQMLAGKIEEGLNQALRHAALFYGIDPDQAGQARVPKDFGISADDVEAVKALIQARAAGDLSRETFWDELKARGYLQAGFDAETETQRLQEEQARDLARV